MDTFLWNVLFITTVLSYLPSFKTPGETRGFALIETLPLNRHFYPTYLSGIETLSKSRNGKNRPKHSVSDAISKAQRRGPLYWTAFCSPALAKAGSNE